MAMFGAIVAGRLVQTNMQQVDDTHFVFTFEQPYEMNHLTVFLTGVAPFPEGYGASIHFQWPQKPYFPLGTLTNERPSAIYRLRPHLPSALPQLAPGEVSPPATLGIEIAPLETVRATAAASSAPSAAVASGAITKPVEVGKLAERIVKNLFNYLHSFGGDIALTPETPIPLAVFQRWYENFTRKLVHDKNASFLDNDD